MPKKRKPRRLADAYRFAGFRPLQSLKGVFGDPQARLITLVRRGKKPSAGPAGPFISAGTIAVDVARGICLAGTIVFTSIWRCGAFSAAAAGR